MRSARNRTNRAGATSSPDHRARPAASLAASRASRSPIPRASSATDSASAPRHAPVSSPRSAISRDVSIIHCTPLTAETETGHLDENVALDLLAGRLGSRVDAVEAHLDRCPACRRFVIQLARAPEHRATEPAGGRAEAAPIEPGARADRYVIDRVRGAGAMGVV